MTYIVLFVSILIGGMTGFISHRRKRGRQRIVHHITYPKRLFKSIPDVGDVSEWPSSMSIHPKQAMRLQQLVRFLETEKQHQKTIKKAFKYKQGFLVPAGLLDSEAATLRPLKKGLWQCCYSGKNPLAFRMLSRSHVLLETQEEYHIDINNQVCTCVLNDKTTAVWPEQQNNDEPDDEHQKTPPPSKDNNSGDGAIFAGVS